MLSVRFRPLLGKLEAPPEMQAPGFDAPPLPSKTGSGERGRTIAIRAAAG
jgi:hypothetical protein